MSPTCELQANANDPTAGAPAAAAVIGRDVSARVLENLRFMLVQGLATGTTFGLMKPIPEAIAKGLADFGGASPDAANLYSLMSGALSVGSCHSLFSRMANGALNERLGIPTYVAKGGELQKFFVELLTVAFSVYVTFGLPYGIRGYFAEGVKNEGLGILVVMASKMLATISGGFLQGAMTNGLRQLMESLGYMESKPSTRGIRPALAELLDNMTFSRWFDEHREIAAVLAASLSYQITPSEFNGIDGDEGFREGLTSMTVYLTGWFFIIYFGKYLFGPMVDHWLNADKTPAQATTGGVGAQAAATGTVSTSLAAMLDESEGEDKSEDVTESIV